MKALRVRNRIFRALRRLALFAGYHAYYSRNIGYRMMAIASRWLLEIYCQLYDPCPWPKEW